MKKITIIFLKSILIVIMLAIVLVCYGIFKYIYPAKVKAKEMRENGEITQKIEEIEKKEGYVKTKDIDPIYLKCVIEAEDRRFYDHGALDIISILRAIKTNFENKSVVEGGSTITQQLVKNIFLDQRQNLNRKIYEVFIAQELENMISKEKILELYVNTSYFGAGYYGIGNATKGYYDKSPNKLSLDESAFLAGVPNAPSVYNPYSNYDLAIKRRNVVLQKMLSGNIITQEEYDELRQKEITVKEKK